MTEHAAGRDGSPPARARDDSGPSATQGTAADADAAARTADGPGPAATSGAVPPADGAHPGAAADATGGAADGPAPNTGGDHTPSDLANGTLGRSYAAVLGSPTADTGSAAPTPEPPAVYGDPDSSSNPVVPASLRPESRQDLAAARSGTAPTADETASGAAAPSEPPAPPGIAADAASVEAAPVEAAPVEAVADTTAAAREAASEDVASAAAVGAAEADPRDRLGRPGSPVLAFAAIAGVVLMATPFAVNETSQRLPGTAIALADQEGVLGYFMRADTGTDGDSTVTTERQLSAGTSESGLVTGVEERPAPDSGYVPEVLPQEESEQDSAGNAEEPDSGDAGSAPDASTEGGSSGSSDGEGSEASRDGLSPNSGGEGEGEDAPGSVSGSDGESSDSDGSGGDGNPPHGGDDEGEGEDTQGPGSDSDAESGESEDSGDSDDSGGSEGDGDSPLGGLPDHNTDGPVTMAAPQGSDGDEGTDATAADDRDRGSAREGEGPGAEGEPLNPDNGTPLTEVVPQGTPEEQRPREQVDQEPQTPRNGEGTDGRPGEPQRDQPPAGERPPAEGAPLRGPEFRYAEVAGVGCAPNERIAYGTAGEFWEGDGTNSWAFGFEGGFTQENCDGRWHAIPVSGDPDQPNGRYAFWTFNIGFTGAQCDIYVHIPDAESPRWVGGAPAQYRLHPSADPATSEPFASFRVDQVADKGGWVHVGTYTPPGDTISVKLQNSGTDRIDGQDTNAHVVASAVRTRCN
ncbi:carbohydrate-binding protein [Nocardiopsis aegyptia]|uniref:Uncharacterized protein n=1 Tax=Nocardiopsis aegyptia TaxID=220378 RepID=A0A7Z0JDC7_9ACTN|nr:hypothetical protein [Nocardiopsis aegyptia]NYJ37907.1 hypothetical protein [Nocardiopsis aegyptia]